MIKQFKALLAGTAIALMCFSCAGGTRGTGGIEFSGTVVNQILKPISGVSVVLVETGDTATTDANGKFTIIGAPPAGAVNIQVSGSSFDSSVSLGEVSERTLAVRVTVSVNEETGEVDRDDLEVDEDDRGSSSSRSNSSSSSRSRSSATNSSRNDDDSSSSSVSSSRSSHSSEHDSESSSSSSSSSRSSSSEHHESEDSSSSSSSSSHSH